MAYTVHGYPIPGTINDEPYKKEQADCGGPLACDVCMKDSARLLESVTRRPVTYAKGIVPKLGGRNRSRM